SGRISALAGREGRLRACMRDVQWFCPLTPVHTGTEIKPVEMPVTTITPVSDAGGLQDFIYWRPDADRTGMEPVYVILNDPLDSGRFTRKQLNKNILNMQVILVFSIQE
ncbi:S-type pyocin domain-containing protein, partial [Shigella flexneri]